VHEPLAAISENITQPTAIRLANLMTCLLLKETTSLEAYSQACRTRLRRLPRPDPDDTTPVASNETRIHAQPPHPRLIQIVREPLRIARDHAAGNVEQVDGQEEPG
jgi:hypothetical protein